MGSTKHNDRMSPRYQKLKSQELSADKETIDDIFFRLRRINWPTSS